LKTFPEKWRLGMEKWKRWAFIQISIKISTIFEYFFRKIEAFQGFRGFLNTFLVKLRLFLKYCEDFSAMSL
jgi:hypothetical protein